MKKEEFNALKDGDKVVANESVPYKILVGTVLTRVTHWLDDDSSARFYFEDEGVTDSHFFSAEEVDFIKE